MLILPLSPMNEWTAEQLGNYYKSVAEPLDELTAEAMSRTSPPVAMSRMQSWWLDRSEYTIKYSSHNCVLMLIISSALKQYVLSGEWRNARFLHEPR